MSLEENGAAPLFVAATRPHLILGADPRAFWMCIVIFVVSMMIHNVKVNIFGTLTAIVVFFFFRTLGEFAPYAIDELQRFSILPSWGTSDAAISAPRRYTPYPEKKAKKK